MIGLVRRFRFLRWSDSIVVFLGFGFWCGVCSDLSSSGDGADSSPLYERERGERREERERVLVWRFEIGRAHV